MFPGLSCRTNSTTRFTFEPTSFPLRPTSSLSRQTPKLPLPTTTSRTYSPFLSTTLDSVRATTTAATPKSSQYSEQYTASTLRKLRSNYSLVERYVFMPKRLVIFIGRGECYDLVTFLCDLLCFYALCPMKTLSPVYFCFSIVV